MYRKLLNAAQFAVQGVGVLILALIACGLFMATRYVPTGLMLEGGVNVCTVGGSANAYTMTCAGTGGTAIQAYTANVSYCGKYRLL